jgi:hypothetical protein
MTDRAHKDLRAGAGLAAAGVIGCLAAMGLALVADGAAWRAWLGASVLWASAPIGALVLLMIMRLVPGAWTQDLAPALERLALLIAPAALVFLPVLFVLGRIYAWPADDTAFRSAYLSSPGYGLRTIVWFAALAGLAFVLVVRRAGGAAVASIGLIAFLPFATLISTDWLLSLDAGYASSGFALYVTSAQVLQAFALAVVLGAMNGVRPQRTGLLAGLLLTLLLLWTYFLFMPYFITWSDNLPAGVRWYHRRTEGGWGWVMPVIAASRLVAIAGLLFKAVRNSRRALVTLSALVLAGAVLEMAWLALPAPPPLAAVSWRDVALYGLCTVVMGALMIGLHRLASDRLERRRE